jgi:hypothetical protein
MHLYRIPFKQHTANLLTLLGGDHPDFGHVIGEILVVGVEDAEGESLDTSCGVLKGLSYQREASGYTVDKGPFVVRADYRTGEVTLWGQELQELTVVIAVTLKKKRNKRVL